MSQSIAAVSHDEITNYVEEWRVEHDCPGMSVAIVDRTETVFAAGFGMRQRDSDEPSTPDTLYGVGSVTKPITATAVLCLVEQGDIALDDAVADYVPYFENAPGEPITVHELLSHTSGMPVDDVATLILSQETFDTELDPSIDGWDSFETYISDSVDRRRTDQERFLYYNSGYVVLSRLVEAVAETPYTQFVEQAVFDPLGMETVTFDVRVLTDKTRDAMTPYLRDEDDTLQSVQFPDNPVFKPPGGLLASVTDLTEFLLAQISGGPHLDNTLCTRMHEPVVVSKRLIGGTKHGYGYGWETRPFGTDTLVGHSGGTGVSAGYIGFLQERGLGVAVGCNTHPTESPEILAGHLLSMLTDRDPVSVLPRRALDRKTAALTGQYESYHGIRSATVTWTGSRLEIEHEHPLDCETVRFTPTSLDPTEHEFVTSEGNGMRTTAEFFLTDDDVELLLDWVLLRRVEDCEDGE
jgi:CubicO group peptidase (beta-lactamase class C family)